MIDMMNYQKLWRIQPSKLESLCISPVYILAGFLNTEIELELYLERKGDWTVHY